jgi:hypothetical protein
MYKVQRAGHGAGREVVVVRDEDRLVGGASLEFIDWMREEVPSKHLRTEQLALVQWRNARTQSIDGLIG